MTALVELLDIGGAGPRVVVKDVIDVAGVPTRAGSRAFADGPPARAHADVVMRMLAAGCRIVGKATLHELAFGVTGINDWAGTAVNPLDPRRIPGGSSSGSAVAVASGVAEIALGTDTGGSIRIPAACCGVVGLKPSFGRISRAGVVPAQSSLDCVGPFARDMAGINFAMAALDPGFVPLPIAPVRIARLDLPAAPEVGAAIDDVLERSGFTVSSIPPPDLDAAFEAGLAIINRENFVAFGHLLGRGLLGADVETRLAAAGAVTDAHLDRAEKVRAAFQAEVDGLLERFDLLALPTMAALPPTIEEVRRDRSAVGLTAYVRPFNLSGHPALALPVPSRAGFPASLQLVARRGADARLCAAGRRIEAAALSLQGEASHA